MLHSSSSLMRYVLHDFGPMSVKKNNFKKYNGRFYYRCFQIFLPLQILEKCVSFFRSKKSWFTCAESNTHLLYKTYVTSLTYTAQLLI